MNDNLNADYIMLWALKLKAKAYELLRCPIGDPRLECGETEGEWNLVVYIPTDPNAEQPLESYEALVSWLVEEVPPDARDRLNVGYKA